MALPDVEGGNIVYKLLLESVQAVETLRDLSKVSEQVGQEITVSFDKAFQGASASVTYFGRLLKGLVDDGATLRQAFEAIRTDKVFGPQTVQGARDLSEAVGRLQGGFAKAGTAADGMGKKLLTATKRILGLTSAIVIIQRLIQGFVRLVNEGIQEYEEFTLAQFKLEVGIRAAQRQMGLAAGTTEEWTAFIRELREQFGIFSTKDLTEGVSKIILLTRELGFTKEQMMDVSRAATILSEVTGVTMAEASRRIAFFLDTGMSRGLATLGVQVNKAVVEQEALAQGIEETWNEMTRQERAAIGLTAIMKQVADLQDDAGRITETFAGRVKTLEADIVDMKVELGEAAQGLRIFALWIEKAAVAITTGLVLGIKYLIALFTALGVNAYELGIIIPETFRAIRENIPELILGIKDIGDILDEQFAKFDERRRERLDPIREMLFPDDPSLGQVAEDELGALEEELAKAEREAKELADAIEKSVDDIADSFQRLADASDDALTRMQDRLEDLSTDFAFDIIDAARDLGFKLQDIDRKAGDQLEKARIKRDERLADLAWDTRNKIAELNADARNEELREEARFNLELLQMQRRYLFDLEDAVRERDARRVLDLMRRFNLERTEAQENYDMEREERERQLELDIAEVKRGEQRKRLEIMRTFELRRQEIERNRMRERAAARRDYQRELEEIFENEKRRREAIQLMYDRRIRDLEIQHARRLEAIGRNLGKEIGLNQEAAQAVIDIWSQAYKGVAQIASAIRGLQQGMAAAGSATAGTVAGTSVEQLQANPELKSHLRYVGAYQHGGSVVARSPTMALFGEAGAERATFTPLRGDRDQDRVGIDLNVRSSDGFIVEVADQVMNEVADVIVNTERGR
jgi:hypothetical protein